MDGCLFLGHVWQVTTWRTNVLLRVPPAEDRYDQRPDGVEERWVPFLECSRCGMMKAFHDGDES